MLKVARLKEWLKKQGEHTHISYTGGKANGGQVKLIRVRLEKHKDRMCEAKM